ncbi:MAG: S8 family serine peptidase [Acidobacteriota bacterium]
MKSKIAFLALTLALLIVSLPKSRAQESSLRDVSLIEDHSDRERETFVRGRLLIGVRPQIAKKSARRLFADFGARRSTEIRGTQVYIVDLPEGVSEESYIDIYSSLPEVEFVELDQLHSPDEMIPNDPSFQSQWHLPKVSAPAAWSLTTGSNAVKIAILDTGVDPYHPDLSSKLVPGWNIFNNTPDTRDVYGHGTKVAGVAAASTNNATGVASVGWNCLIMPIRVSDTKGYATTSAIANGLVWAADHGARVANISYKVTTSSTVTNSAKYFYGKGGVIAVSAGNDATFDSAPDNPYVLTVSGTASDDSLASFSTRGNNIDLSAPAVSVLTTTSGGGYGPASGTSFSAPLVAGAAGLLLSMDASLSAQKVRDILCQAADDRGPSGWDSSYGWGRLNVDQAVRRSTGSPPPPPPPGDTTPPVVSITSPAPSSTLSGTVTVAVTASDNTGVASVNLQIDGASLGAVSQSSYNFTWNTTAAGDGPHTLTAQATDLAGNVSTQSITVTVKNTVTLDAPPKISITSPYNGAVVYSKVAVKVAASDDRGVVKVDFYVDGRWKASSTNAPFTIYWDTRLHTKGAHLIQCKAHDASGNVALSPIIRVYKMQ